MDATRHSDSSPRRHRRRLALLLVAVAAAFVAGEMLSRTLDEVSHRRDAYDFVVGTHLVDMDYRRFIEGQEAIFQARQRAGKERSRPHAALGWIYNPNTELHFDGAFGHVDLHINSHGLRGPEFPREKPPGEFRIVCVGGSTTACEEVGDDATWPARIQEELQPLRPDLDVRVINAGIPSYDVRRSLDHFLYRLCDLSPDVLVVYHGINDLFRHRIAACVVDEMSDLMDDLVEPFAYQFGESHAQGLGPLLSSSSLLRRLYNTARALAHSRPPRKALGDVDPAGIDGFCHEYRALIGLARDHDCSVVAVTFALAWPGDFATADAVKIDRSFDIWCGPIGASREVGRRILRAQNEAIRSLARLPGVSVCELEDRVPPDREHFVDCCHLTATGNAVIGARIARVIHDAQLLVR